MKKSIAIQMDNIEKIDYEFDTSFLIGYEAQERDYDIFYYNPKDLFIKENTIQASGYYLELLLDEKNYFNFKSNKIIAKFFIFLKDIVQLNISSEDSKNESLLTLILPQDARTKSQSKIAFSRL